MNRSNYLLGVYEKAFPNHLSIPEKLIFAKEVSFDFMEISIDETDEKLSRLDYDKNKRFEILTKVFETGIKIDTMCLSAHRKYPLGSENEVVRKRSIEIMNNAILFARDLGIRMIQIAGYDEYYNESNEKTRAFFYEGLKKSVDIASKYGVILAFETMETPFLNSITKAKYWVDKINSPFLQIYPDSGNITNAATSDKVNVIDDIRNGENNIAAFHLKEAVFGKYREIPYGTGYVDFDNIIKKALEIGVRRFTCEFWDTDKDNWMWDINYAYNFMKEKFDKINL